MLKDKDVILEDNFVGLYDRNFTLVSMEMDTTFWTVCTMISLDTYIFFCEKYLDLGRGWETDTVTDLSVTNQMPIVDCSSLK